MTFKLLVPEATEEFRTFKFFLGRRINGQITGKGSDMDNE